MKSIFRYIDWHYYVALPKLITVWINATLFCYYYFSVPLHLSTLFLPWKRQKMRMRVGFHLDDFFTALSFNIFSRIIGTIARSIVITYGLFFMLLSFLIFLIPVIVWILLPFLSILIYFAQKPAKEIEGIYYKIRAKKDLKKLALLLFKHAEGKFIAGHLNLDLKNILWYINNQTDIGKYEIFEKNLKQEKKYLRISDLFRALTITYQPLVTILARNKILSDDLYQTAVWYELIQDCQSPPLILNRARIRSLSGIGHNWAYGFTVEFDEFSTDLTKQTSAFPLLVGREEEMKTLQQVLLKSERNNALIIGDPGLGRHILVETLAHRIITGNCSPSLTHKRLVQLDMHSLVGSAPTTLEVKGLAKELLTETEQAGNIIVVIDDMDKYTSNAEGMIDLSDVLAKFAKSSTGVIGITTPYGYHKYIEPNTSLSLFFEKIELPDLSLPTILAELEISIVPVLEQKYHMTISYSAIKKAIDDANRYVSSTPFPAKAIELLDEACVYLTTKRKERFLYSGHIDDFLSEKLHVKIGQIQMKEKNLLINLENLLHKQIINQEQAINILSSSLRRRRLDVSSPNRPIGSFLFLGPTGVGKTETAKALASLYFDSDKSLLRFDMSQYQKEEGLERLIGSAILGLPGELTSALRDNPFSLLLLDEFEKAEKVIFNIFLTLTDEGYINDSMGRKVDAKNTIIIATSNAGAEFIREKINQGISGIDLQKKLIDYVQREKIYSPELLNRFDSVIVFTPLSEGHLREVARLMLNDLNKRLVRQDMKVNITDDLVNKLAQKGFDPQFGGRAMRRVITEVIEDQIAQRILNGEAIKGQPITINL